MDEKPKGYAPLRGPRHEVVRGQAGFPAALAEIPRPPKRLYVVGSLSALRAGLAVVGARKSTPYGRSAAKLFAGRAAQWGVCVVSGGARGCDAHAHEAALANGGQTVAFLGGGCDVPYPWQNADLFQRIVDAGGAVVSEYSWEVPPLPYGFRARNRLIAGLARATLIVEAGLPSGTFSTADEALAANREVLAVPGSIFSKTSAGSNALLAQGATPMIDAESLDAVLARLFPDQVPAPAAFGQLAADMEEGDMQGCEGNRNNVSAARERASGAARGGRGAQAKRGDSGARCGGEGGSSAVPAGGGLAHAAKLAGIAGNAAEAVHAALAANPMRLEQLVEAFSGSGSGPAGQLDVSELMTAVVGLEATGAIERFADGRFGATAL